MDDPQKKTHGQGIKHEVTEQTRSQVESLVGFGLTQAQIAQVMRIADRTLRDLYRDELDGGVFKANAAVARSLYRAATGNGPSSVTAAIFWMKSRAGWRESPQEMEVAVRTESASAEDRAKALAALLAKAKKAKAPESAE